MFRVRVCAQEINILHFLVQANVCHAYQVVQRNIPDEQIVVMMYDDLAHNTE